MYTQDLIPQVVVVEGYDTMDMVEMVVGAGMAMAAVAHMAAMVDMAAVVAEEATVEEVVEVEGEMEAEVDDLLYILGQTTLYRMVNVIFINRIAVKHVSSYYVIRNDILSVKTFDEYFVYHTNNFAKKSHESYKRVHCLIPITMLYLNPRRGRDENVK